MVFSASTQAGRPYPRCYGDVCCGKILLVGGNGTASAEKIDLLSATPAWQTVTSMKFPRIYHHVTVLAQDGADYLVTGGQNPNGPVLAAELWNPLTGSWTTMSAAQLERRYHSVGLLLPDGRVMVGGGGRKGTALLTAQDVNVLTSIPLQGSSANHWHCSYQRDV